MYDLSAKWLNDIKMILHVFKSSQAARAAFSSPVLLKQTPACGRPWAKESAFPRRIQLLIRMGRASCPVRLAGEKQLNLSNLQFFRKNRIRLRAGRACAGSVRIKFILA